MQAETSKTLFVLNGYSLRQDIDPVRVFVIVNPDGSDSESEHLKLRSAIDELLETNLKSKFDESYSENKEGPWVDEDFESHCLEYGESIANKHGFQIQARVK